MVSQEEILKKARDESIKKFELLRKEKENLFEQYEDLFRLIWELGAGVVPRYLLSDVLQSKEIFLFDTDNKFSSFITKLEKYKLIKTKKFEGTTKIIIILTSFTLGKLTDGKITRIDYNKQKVVLSTFKFSYVYINHIKNKQFNTDDKFDKLLHKLRNNTSLLCNPNQGYKFTQALLENSFTKNYISDFLLENHALMNKRFLARREAFKQNNSATNTKYPKSKEQSLDTLINRNIYISISESESNNKTITINAVLFDVYNNLYTSKIAKYIVHTYQLLKKYFSQGVSFKLNFKIVTPSKQDSLRLKQDFNIKKQVTNKIHLRMLDHQKNLYGSELTILPLILNDINISLGYYKIQERLFDYIYIENLKEARKMKNTKTKELEEKINKMENVQQELLKKIEELEKK